MLPSRCSLFQQVFAEDDESQDDREDLSAVSKELVEEVVNEVYNSQETQTRRSQRLRKVKNLDDLDEMCRVGGMACSRSKAENSGDVDLDDIVQLGLIPVVVEGDEQESMKTSPEVIQHEDNQEPDASQSYKKSPIRRRAKHNLFDENGNVVIHSSQKRAARTTVASPGQGVKNTQGRMEVNIVADAMLQAKVAHLQATIATIRMQLNQRNVVIERLIANTSLDGPQKDSGTIVVGNGNIRYDSESRTSAAELNKQYCRIRNEVKKWLKVGSIQIPVPYKFDHISCGDTAHALTRLQKVHVMIREVTTRIDQHMKRAMRLGNGGSTFTDIARLTVKYLPIMSAMPIKIVSWNVNRRMMSADVRKAICSVLGDDPNGTMGPFSYAHILGLQETNMFPMESLGIEAIGYDQYCAGKVSVIVNTAAIAQMGHEVRVHDMNWPQDIKIWESRCVAIDIVGTESVNMCDEVVHIRVVNVYGDVARDDVSDQMYIKAMAHICEQTFAQDGICGLIIGDLNLHLKVDGVQEATNDRRERKMLDILDNYQVQLLNGPFYTWRKGLLSSVIDYMLCKLEHLSRWAYMETGPYWSTINHRSNDSSDHGMLVTTYRHPVSMEYRYDKCVPSILNFHVPKHAWCNESIIQTVVQAIHAAIDPRSHVIEPVYVDTEARIEMAVAHSCLNMGIGKWRMMGVMSPERKNQLLNEYLKYYTTRKASKEVQTDMWQVVNRYRNQQRANVKELKLRTHEGIMVEGNDAYQYYATYMANVWTSLIPGESTIPAYEGETSCIYMTDMNFKSLIDRLYEIPHEEMYLLREAVSLLQKPTDVATMQAVISSINDKAYTPSLISMSAISMMIEHQQELVNAESPGSLLVALTRWANHMRGIMSNDCEIQADQVGIGEPFPFMSVNILLPKSGDKHDPARYRLISMMRMMAKIYDKCALHMWEKASTLCPQVLGFSENIMAYRRGMSAYDTLVTIQAIRDILVMVDMHIMLRISDGVKAFDMQPQERTYQVMMAKTGYQASEYCKAMLNRLKSHAAFLRVADTETTVRVRCNGRSVMQGSAMGPFLWNLYSELVPKICKDCGLDFTLDLILRRAVSHQQELSSRVEDIRNSLGQLLMKDIGVIMFADNTFNFAFENETIRVGQAMNQVECATGHQFKTEESLEGIRTWYRLGKDDTVHHKTLGVILQADRSYREHISLRYSKFKHSIGLVMGYMCKCKEDPWWFKKVVINATIMSVFTYADVLYGPWSIPIRNGGMRPQAYVNQMVQFCVEGVDPLCLESLELLVDLKNEPETLMRGAVKRWLELPNGTHTYALYIVTGMIPISVIVISDVLTFYVTKIKQEGILSSVLACAEAIVSGGLSLNCNQMTQLATDGRLWIYNICYLRRWITRMLVKANITVPDGDSKISWRDALVKLGRYAITRLIMARGDIPQVLMDTTPFAKCVVDGDDFPDFMPNSSTKVLWCLRLLLGATSLSADMVGTRHLQGMTINNCRRCHQVAETSKHMFQCQEVTLVHYKDVLMERLRRVVPERQLQVALKNGLTDEYLAYSIIYKHEIDDHTKLSEYVVLTFMGILFDMYQYFTKARYQNTDEENYQCELRSESIEELPSAVDANDVEMCNFTLEQALADEELNDDDC
jgi:hypothetical protein